MLLMTSLNVDQLFRELDYLREGVDRVEALLKAQNGRIGKVEIRVAILWWALGGIFTAGAAVAGVVYG